MKPRTDLISKFEYIKLCAERAILQEKGEMEKLGPWYKKQQLNDIQRSVKKCRTILEPQQKLQL